MRKLLVVVACGMVLTACGQESSNPNGATPYTEAEKAEIATKAEALKTGWAYREDKDPMTDGMTHSACVTSRDRVGLQPPYDPVTADLCIRQSPQHGLDVMVGLNGDGQMLCQSYRSCSVKVRFGDGQQQTFSAIGAADNSSNMVFIENARRFVEAVKSAPVTRIQATFYEAGDQVMEFKTADLEWPRPTSNAPN